MPTKLRKRVLFVFAHQDDEYFSATRIRREIARGHDVRFAYLTDGGGYGATPAVRDAETVAVLDLLGVPRPNIHFLGSAAGVPDGKLVDHVDASFERIRELFDDAPLHRLYCLAWEGGHPDHDAAHLITLAYAKRRGLLARTWQFPSYNGFRRPGPFFRVHSPLPNGRRKIDLPVLRSEATWDVWLASKYPSQRRSFLGLVPGHFVERVGRARESLQAVSLEHALERPHSGPLLYERRYGVRFEDFQQATASFVAREVAAP